MVIFTQTISKLSWLLRLENPSRIIPHSVDGKKCLQRIEWPWTMSTEQSTWKSRRWDWEKITFNLPCLSFCVYFLWRKSWCEYYKKFWKAVCWYMCMVHMWAQQDINTDITPNSRAFYVKHFLVFFFFYCDVYVCMYKVNYTCCRTYVINSTSFLKLPLRINKVLTYQDHLMLAVCSIDQRWGCLDGPVSE